MKETPARFRIPLRPGRPSAAIRAMRVEGPLSRFRKGERREVIQELALKAWSTFKGFKTMAKRRALRDMPRDWHADGCDARPGRFFTPRKETNQ